MRMMLIVLAVLAGAPAVAQSTLIAPDWSQPMIDWRKPMQHAPQLYRTRMPPGLKLPEPTRCMIYVATIHGSAVYICGPID